MGNETVEGDIVKHRSTSRVFFIVLNACLGSFFFGYNMGVLNLGGQKTIQVYGKTDNPQLENGLLTSAVPLGAAIGAFGSSVLLGRMGRRPALMLTDIIGIIGSGLLLIPNLYSGIIARFVCGLSVGLNSSIVPTYVREMSPTGLSGMTGTMNQVFINAGVVLSYALGLGLPQNDTDPQHTGFWRFVLGFPIITCGLRLVGFLTFVRFDTPLYYLSQEQASDARRVLEDIYLDAYVDEVMNDMSRVAEEKAATKLTYGAMFDSHYRYRTLLGMAVQFFQQFSGINAVIFFSGIIFNSILNNTNLSNIMVLVQGIVNTAASLLCALLLKSFGRKTFLIGGQWGCTLVMVLLGVLRVINWNEPSNQGLQYSILVFVFVYLIVFNLSLGPIAWLYDADILPESGMSFAVLTNWLCCFMIGLISPSVLGSQTDQKSLYPVFFFFAGCCAIGGVILQIYMKETKDLSPDQINRLFKPENEKPVALLDSKHLTDLSDA